MAPQAKEFDYFASKDGEQVAEKMAYVLKPIVPLAGYLGICDIMLISRPKGVLNTAVRFAFVSLPIVGVASAFVLATNALGSLRKKDDHLNWLAGGFLAGSSAGLIKKSGMWGFNVGLLFGIAAVIRKEMGFKGYELIPTTVRHRIGNVSDCLANYSLYEDRPQTWTTGPTSS